MVTFSLPGDGDVAASNGTPKARLPLPFAKRAFAASPFGGGSARRLGTPQSASARKMLTTRDEIPASSLNNNSIATARNIFRASAISDSPPATAFSPSLPASTMKKVFAPGATPEPSRVYRESTAQATPRGMAANTTTKELFPMRISSPPPELTGELLTKKVPKEWNSKGSIYADQFLSHLCPPNLDEEQRRQFFCILDLRRLKYAANEIFWKKDWKLNVINFAKEFEKSRSIILLRYGLYEFQNVKPSKDVLKRWRREHGLPEPEEEAVEPTPTKPTSFKKRKADDELTNDKAPSGVNTSEGKRRAMEKPEQVETPVTTPAFGKNKRKASMSDEPPSKMQKSTPSSAKSLFEKIANKSITKSTEDAPAAKPTPLPASKSSSNSLARSMFTNLKPPVGQATGSGNNIFGYLSDASSAKNSGVEADAESETDSDADDSPEAGQSDEPSIAPSGTGEMSSQSGPSMFGKKPAPATGFGTGASTTPETRESTPGRSLFDRITKDDEGQAVRAETPEVAVAKKASPVDQTWNPSTTPIKFAPSAPVAPAAPPPSLFSSAASTPGGSIFAPKTTSSNAFGAAAPKQGQTSEKASSAGTPPVEADKSGGESDKENDSQAPKSMFEPKAPAAQANFGASMFQPKPAATEAPKAGEAPKPIGNMFGALSKPAEKSETAAPSNIFGSANKPSDSTAAPTTVMQSSTLFGAKPAESGETPGLEAPKAPSMFGASAKAPESGSANSLFAAKPTTGTSSLFGSGASTPAQSIFGGASSDKDSAAPKTDAAPTSTPAAAAPIFSFGAASKPNDSAAAPKPMFGGPKSPPSSTANNMFGSPMKQDDPSPAKKTFTGPSSTGSSGAQFGFGNPNAAPTTSNIFGAASNPAPTNGNSAASSFNGGQPAVGGGSFGFNFSAAGSAGTSFNNPFASGNNGAGAASTSTPPAGGMFNFGGPSASAAAPATGGSGFQFGGPSGGVAGPSAGSSFGESQPGQTSAPSFGGSSTPGGAPSFNFTAASPQPPQGSVSMFGSTQQQPSQAFGNLQPPAGGSSTTGTNSPFNLGGGSSLATTPAGGTPEPSGRTDQATGGENEEGEKHEQISLTEGLEADEETLHEVRAKVLKFVPPGEKSDDDDKPKSKSPWSTQGVGPLRLLKHKETGALRLLLRAEPRGHIALNRSVLPDMSYKADEKYVRMTTSNEKGDGLETWMVQVKTKDLAQALAESLEKHKELNKK